MIERIEANSTDKKLKLLRILGITLIVITAIRFVSKADSIIGLGGYVDSLLMILIGGYLTYKSYTSETKNRLGQFIEWNNESIKYRLKGDQEVTTILKSKIRGTAIELDKIIITTSDHYEYSLDISDFQEYEKRLKIKKNFDRQ